MSITANDNGVLHKLDTIAVNDGGVLRVLKSVTANDGGVLRKMFSKTILPDSLPFTDDGGISVYTTGYPPEDIHVSVSSSKFGISISDAFELSKATKITFAGEYYGGASEEDYYFCIYVDGTQVCARRKTYGSFTNFIKVDSGTHTIKIEAMSDSTGVNTKSIADFKITFE